MVQGGLYAVQENYMDAQEGFVLFRGVICCSKELNTVQARHMDVQEGCTLFRGVICCSECLYAVQGSYLVFKWVKCMFRGVICCSGGYMLFKEVLYYSGGLYDEEIWF